MDFYASFDELFDVLRNAKENNIKCNLLIGAGCSASANIPTADGILKKIEKEYPAIYNSVEDKTYAKVMNRLSRGERKNLITKLVENAKVNMGHIAIAQLLKEGYVHRILTPNFDNLLVRACSMAGEFPPVYDLAAYEEFKPEYIPEKCIFYLHGQYTGFKLMNTDKEVEEQAEKLRKLFTRLNENSLWIIVGYSGVNDVIYNLLKQVDVFDYRLYWVGYKDHDPSDELATNFLSEEKYAFYVKGYDSDSFFSKLAQKLGIFPPKYILEPFSYVKTIVDNIVPMSLEYAPKNIAADINESTNNLVQKAIDGIENDPKVMANHYFRLGLYDQVLEQKGKLLKLGEKTLIGNTYFHKAYSLHNDEHTIEEFNQLIDLYSQCLVYNHKESAAYHNIGLCFAGLGQLVKQKEEEYFFKAADSYAKSLEMYQQETLYFANFMNLLEKHMGSILSDVLDVMQFSNEHNDITMDNALESGAEWTSKLLSALGKDGNVSKFDSNQLTKYISALLNRFPKKKTPVRQSRTS